MNKEVYEVFLRNVVRVFDEFLELKLNIIGDLKEEAEEMTSYGVTSIISFTGKFNGRVLLDMDTNLALGLANKLTGETYQDPKDTMVMASISEMNNMVTGNTVVDINNELNFHLWLAPPIVMTGKTLMIALPKLKSYSYDFDAAGNKVRYNISFEGGGM